MVNTLEIFREQLVHTGSITIQCQCGRQYIADDDLNQLEPEERQHLEEYEKAQPELVVHEGCSSIEWGSIDGKQIVPECPCGADKRYHSFLISHRGFIIAFLKKVLEEEKKEQKRKEEDMRGL